MSRILIDSTGSYDLSKVSAVTIGKVTIRTGEGTSGVKSVAILNLEGGQVLHTDTPYDRVASQWLSVKQQEDAPPSLAPTPTSVTPSDTPQPRGPVTLQDIGQNPPPSA